MSTQWFQLSLTAVPQSSVPSGGLSTDLTVQGTDGLTYETSPPTPLYSSRATSPTPTYPGQVFYYFKASFVAVSNTAPSSNPILTATAPDGTTETYPQWESVTFPGSVTGQPIGSGNHNPTAAADSFGAASGLTTSLAVLNNDTDQDGDPLTVSAITIPAAHGSATISSDHKSIAYTSNAGYVGVDTLAYSISDGKGGTSSASVSVNVTQSNRPPVANADNYTVAYTGQTTLAVLNNDTDPDAGETSTLTIVSASQPGIPHGSVTVSSDHKSLIYTSPGNYSGPDVAISYTIQDIHGAQAFGTASVTIITPDTTPPLLISTSPADNSSNVPFDSNIVLTFSEAVKAGVVSGGIEVHKNSDGSLVASSTAGTLQVSYSGSTVTLNPTADLNTSTDYYVTVAGGAITDTAGNIFAGLTPTQLNFTTALPVATITNSPSVLEGDSSFTTMTFNVQLTGAPSHHDPVFISYDFNAIGSTRPGIDFDNTPGVLQIPDGSLTAQINVKVYGDQQNEGNQAFDLVLHQSNTVSLPNNVVSQPYVGTIVDDDAPVAVPDDGSNPTVEATKAEGESFFDQAYDLFENADPEGDSIAHLLSTQAAKNVQVWIKDGLSVVDVLGKLKDAVGSFEKGLAAYKSSGAAAGVHAASQDALVWIGSGYAGGIVGETTAVLLGSTVLGPVGAVVVGAVAAGVVIGVFQQGLNKLFPAPSTGGSSSGVQAHSSEATAFDVAGNASIAASPLLTSSSNGPSAQVGQAAPDLYWQIDPNTGVITVLKPITPAIQATLDRTAAQLNVKVATPVALAVTGDTDSTSPNDVLFGGSGADTVNGGNGDDTLFGRDGNDILSGGPGNDTLYGGAGNDILIGGGGTDTAVYGAASNNYTLISYNGTVAVLSRGADGIDRLQGVTNIQFSDKTVAAGTATPFDPWEYLASNPDLITAFGPNPQAGFDHYINTGFTAGRATNAFNALEYLASNTDLITAFGLNTTAAAQHYVQAGFNGHRPTASFNALEYIASNPDLITAFGLNTTAATQHYVQAGFNEHRPTTSFDAVEYLASNPDLITAFGLNTTAATQHYIQAGFHDGRATTSFDPYEYVASNTDLIPTIGVNAAAATLNYVQTGYNAHRATNSFDAAEYLASNPDLLQAFGFNLVAAEQNYISVGFSQQRPTNSFNVAEYLASNTDLLALYGTNFAAAERQYDQAGFSQHRPTGSFDAIEYLASNPDLIQSIGYNPLAAQLNYVQTGFSAHRPTTTFNALEYLASNRDLIQAFGYNTAAATQHYVQAGFRDGRATTSFDPYEYVASNPDLITAVGLNATAATQHYIQAGFHDGRATTTFDAREYLASNTDLIQAFGFNVIAAEQHYIAYGYAEHRPVTSFDAAEYLASNTDLLSLYGANFAAAEQQYIQAGFSQNRPTNSFDAIEYLASNPDLIQSIGYNPLAAELNYVQTGFSAHRPTTSFNALEYIASNPDLITAFGLNTAAATQHYVQAGYGRATTSFDPYEYVASNPDLITAIGSNATAATQHYILAGFSDGRATTSFDALEYLASNPDLIQAFGLNVVAAEQHYINAGYNDHRPTNSFNAMEYLASNTDLIQTFGPDVAAAEQQYIQSGFGQHRPTNSFDAIEYIASNPDLIQAFGLNVAAAEQHYVGAGFADGRATASFNAAQYLANYPDLVSAFGNNLVAAEQHYITNGFSEGRTDQAPVISGDGGDNTLVAKNGAIMTGGAGADTFVFNQSPLTPVNITDFAPGSDHLQISASGFGHGLTAGGTAPLVTAADLASATPTGSGGYFIFDNAGPNAGTVYWDATGGSATDAIALVHLNNIASLQMSDFHLV